MMKMNHIVATALLVFWATSSIAEPVAKLAPLNAYGKQAFAAQGKTEADVQKDLPSKEMVGMPVYPDSYFTAAGGGENALSSVSLISKSSPEEVIAWYQDNLGSKWQNIPELAIKQIGQVTVFVNSENKKIDAFDSLKYRQIAISKVEKPEDTGFAAMMFDVSGIKSMINITVKPMM